jgi:endonuclease-3
VADRGLDAYDPAMPGAPGPRPRAAGRRESKAARAARAAELRRRLADRYPDVTTALTHRSAWELLVATILSAQSTDEVVNRVTVELFRRYPTVADLAGADREELEQTIHATGFFRSKARSVQGAARYLLEHHRGEVPGTMDELVELPGVGRKTANVVMNVAFGEATIAVDTHIFRVGNRTGLAPGKNPLEVELKLLKRVPGEYRLHAHHWLILHGRYTCKARTPECPKCVVNDLCTFKGKTTLG